LTGAPCEDADSRSTIWVGPPSGRHVECQLDAHLKTRVNVIDYFFQERRVHQGCRILTPSAALQRLSGLVEKLRLCADIPDCHRHDHIDTVGTCVAERGGGVDLVDDESELSVNDPVVK
jgi:hypothetical protein